MLPDEMAQMQILLFMVNYDADNLNRIMLQVLEERNM